MPAQIRTSLVFYLILNLPAQKYVWFWALGEYEWHRSGARDGNYPALNGQIVRGFELPFPPLNEQREVVCRIKQLFALTDKIEARVRAATVRVEKITQAILAKAFRGELVPTEAELARQQNRPYEPAAALLERIRAARASAPPSNGKRRPRKATPARPAKASPRKNTSAAAKRR